MTIVRAWAVLVVASAATTAVALAHLAGPAIIAALLALALLKSWVILSDYLQLSHAPAIRRGFMGALVLWAGIALTLAWAG